MFFGDPAAAFANVAAALRPRARLVLLVWQPHDHNAWARAIDAALGDAARPPQPGADPFSLGDAEATAGILEDAGFDGLHFEDVHEPVFYGRDVDAALAIVQGFQDTRAALASLNEREAARTVERLRGTLAAHHSQRARRGPRCAFLADHGPATELSRRRSRRAGDVAGPGRGGASGLRRVPRCGWPARSGAGRRTPRGCAGRRRRAASGRRCRRSPVVAEGLHAGEVLQAPALGVQQRLVDAEVVRVAVHRRHRLAEGDQSGRAAREQERWIAVGVGRRSRPASWDRGRARGCRRSRPSPGRPGRSASPPPSGGRRASANVACSQAMSAALRAAYSAGSGAMSQRLLHEPWTLSVA